MRMATISGFEIVKGLRNRLTITVALRRFFKGEGASFTEKP